MIHLTELLACVVFCVALYGSPEPATLSLASSGAVNGVKGSVPYLIGIVSGIVVTQIITLSGLFALVNSSEVFAVIFKYVGFAYILYLGWKIARSRTGADSHIDTPFKLSHGLLLNTLNPKAYLAAALVFSQFENNVSIVSLMIIIVSTVIVLDIGRVAATLVAVSSFTV